MKRKQTRRFNFTEARLDALATPDEAKKMYDSKVEDLGLKLLPSGKKQFFWFRAVPYEEQPKRPGKPTWRTLGEYPAYTLADARAKVEELNSTLAKWKADGCPSPSFYGDGSNGKKEFVQALRYLLGEGDGKRSEEMTVEKIAEHYFATHLRGKANHPEKAEKDVRYLLNSHLSEWKTRPLSRIREEHVRELHLKLASTPYQANAVRGLVAVLFNHAVKHKLFSGTNPAKNIKPYKKHERKRFVKRDEVPKLFTALKAENNQDLTDYVNLALWTGARKSDILSMRWRDISLPDNRWTVPFSKSGESYEVALTPEAIGILKKRLKKREDDDDDSPWVFPSFGKSWSSHGHEEALEVDAGARRDRGLAPTRLAEDAGLVAGGAGHVATDHRQEFGAQVFGGNENLFAARSRPGARERQRRYARDPRGVEEEAEAARGGFCGSENSWQPATENNLFTSAAYYYIVLFV